MSESASQSTLVATEIGCEGQARANVSQPGQPTVPSGFKRPMRVGSFFGTGRVAAENVTANGLHIGSEELRLHVDAAGMAP